MTNDKSAANPKIKWPRGYRPAQASVFVHHAIQIHALPRQVWECLLDAPSWASWYKYCSDVSILKGDPTRLGPDSQFRFKTLGFFFEPSIVTFESERELAWTAPGPMNSWGCHTWLIEPLATSCILITEETQFGMVTALLKPYLQHQLLRCHQEWIEAIKRRAEGTNSR